MAQITNDWAADRLRLRLIPGGQAAAPTGRRNGQGGFFIPKIQQSKFFRAAQRQKVRKIYGIFY